MFIKCIGQSRLRWTLIPGATKGWNPDSFQSISRALEFAMASKRMKFSWLAQGTRIPIDELKAAVRSKFELSSDEIRKIELYLGVQLRSDVVSKVKRSPP
jgi:hypothetical protein